jgi:hypothetical protein
MIGFVERSIHSLPRSLIGKIRAAVLGWRTGILDRREFCTSGDGAGQISSVHHSVLNENWL